MNTPKHVIEILNELIQINNDRIKGYEQALNDTPDTETDLVVLFDKMKTESVEYISQLQNAVVQMGGQPAAGTTVPGKIYRAWMELNMALNGYNRTALLSCCAHGEQAAQSAYADALDNDLPLDVSSFINVQKAALCYSHDAVHALWNERKTLDQSYVL
ncbi:PA2169 family four-helix-bundle protein [Deminuibacter soli]|nr:PA2169 family four-helix-bundle protein [Deminuibacter soli]